VEPWVGYYDIFLRGAFGSFLDVLREVSFSPMMAQYLTMLENKGMAADGAYPDENFAREIMQVRWPQLERGTMPSGFACLAH
jgi:uncharacterized protein (DUF1800 family)